MHVLLNMVNGDRFVIEYKGDIQHLAWTISDVERSVFMDAIGVDDPLHREYVIHTSHLVSMREMSEWEYKSLMFDDYGALVRGLPHDEFLADD